MTKFNKILLIGSTTAMGAIATSAQAAAYDVTALTTGIGEAAVAVLAVGASVVLVVLGVKVFKWISRSL